MRSAFITQGVSEYTDNCTEVSRIGYFFLSMLVLHCPCVPALSSSKERMSREQSEAPRVLKGLGWDWHKHLPHILLVKASQRFNKNSKRWSWRSILHSMTGTNICCKVSRYNQGQGTGSLLQSTISNLERDVMRDDNRLDDSYLHWGILQDVFKDKVLKTRYKI